MFGSPRGGVAFVAVVVASLSAPAAAYGATPPSTPTTVAAPSTTAPVTTTTQPRKAPPTTSPPTTSAPGTSTPPSSSPPSSTPPPPAAMPVFTLPTNSGLELLKGMQSARESLGLAQLGL